MKRPTQLSHPPNRPSTGLARTLSKLGLCSRQQAIQAILDGRVTVNGHIERDPGRPVDPKRDRLELDRQCAGAAAKLYLALNKPRGLVTTRHDEHDRDTVYQCLEGHDLPFLSPVGRLDRASEGLLLFTNDSSWAALITDPLHHVPKTYHVQIDRIADDTLAARLSRGVTDQGDFLTARNVRVLRSGTRNSWIEVVLDEGRNRHIRRLLAAFGIDVLRLIRIAIGNLQLGTLPKGQFRHLTPQEIQQLQSVPSLPSALSPLPDSALSTLRSPEGGGGRTPH